MNALLGLYSSAQGKLMVQTSADADSGVGGEFILRHLEIDRRRTFADAGGGVVMRSVARAEIAAILAAALAFRRAERHAAEMGTDPQCDQPLWLAGLGAVGQRLRIAQRAEVDGVGGLDLLRGQLTDEDWLLAPDRLDRLAGLDRRDVDVDLGERQHVGRRIHLID